MLVDASRPASENKTKEQWFRHNNRYYAAYVGSVSGHACEIVGMLDKYIKHNQKNQKLEEDLHLFLVQLVAVYIKRGYHSALEIIDVLHDPPIQDLFNQYGVTINLDQYFNCEEAASFFEYAMNDALAYTKHQVYLRYLQQSELHRHSFFTATKNKKTITEVPLSQYEYPL